MEKSITVYKKAWPYQQDKMNLPVKNLEAAIPFYETVMGFKLLSKTDSPHKGAVLERDEIQIGIAENGGDPTQDGCFFEVNNVEAALEEINANSMEKKTSEIESQKHGGKPWRVFFVVAPDGLCYCIGEAQVPGT